MLEVDGDDSSSHRASLTERRNSRVRFSEDDSVTQVPSRYDFSFEELYALWFNEEDYAEVYVENELTEAVMNCEENKHLVDDKLLCARGLVDNESLEARAESNTFVQKLILRQIAYQVNQGIADLGDVAKVYHDCSLPAVRKAQNAALRDAEDAKRYMDL
jgi:hypothetical protein